MAKCRTTDSYSKSKRGQYSLLPRYFAYLAPNQEECGDHLQLCDLQRQFNEVQWGMVLNQTNLYLPAGHTSQDDKTCPGAAGMFNGSQTKIRKILNYQKANGGKATGFHGDFILLDQTAARNFVPLLLFPNKLYPIQLFQE